MPKIFNSVCCLLLVACFLCSHASLEASSTLKSSKKRKITICAAIANPSRYDGKEVVVHARYAGTWEGNWLSDESCKALGDLVLPPDTVPDGKDDVVRDSGWSDFSRVRRQLSNGLTNEGDYDYLMADFTGVIVIKRDFKIEDGFGNGWGHLGMSQFRFFLKSVSNVSPHKW